MVEFGDWLCSEVLQAVPHRHVVLSMLKMLRKAFLYQRRLLSERSRCGWKALKTLYAVTDGREKSVPGGRRKRGIFRIRFVRKRDFLKNSRVQGGLFAENEGFRVFRGVFRSLDISGNKSYGF